MNNAPPKPFATARWTKSTFLGWMLGVVLIMLLSSGLDAAGIENMQFYVGMGMGMGVGLMQWLLLRKYTVISAKWIWASVLGMSLPFIFFDFTLPDGATYKLPVSVAVGGSLTGALQSFSLKRYRIKPSAWILTSFLGWSLAAAMVLLVNYTMKIRGTGYENLLLALLNLVLILSGGMVLGIVTGRKISKGMRT